MQVAWLSMTQQGSFGFWIDVLLYHIDDRCLSLQATDPRWLSEISGMLCMSSRNRVERPYANTKAPLKYTKSHHGGWNTGLKLKTGTYEQWFFEQNRKLAVGWLFDCHQCVFTFLAWRNEIYVLSDSIYLL